MEIDAQITILFDYNGMKVELHDRTSGRTFFRGVLNREQACQSMSRLCRTEIEKAEVFALDKVGMQQEIDTYVFPMPENVDCGERKEIAIKIVDNLLKVERPGWEADHFFGSQDSFFSNRETGVDYARTTIRRWV